MREWTYFGYACFCECFGSGQAPCKKHDTFLRTAALLSFVLALCREHGRQGPATSAARCCFEYRFEDLASEWLPAMIMMRSCRTSIYSLCLLI